MTEIAPHPILVIDDDESFRFILAQKLTQAGYSITTAANGAHAIQILQAGKMFELILCDLKMPLQGGVEFVKSLKDHNIKTPVIIMTGYPEREKIIEAALNGVTEVLLKPIKSADLIRAIRVKLGQDAH